MFEVIKVFNLQILLPILVFGILFDKLSSASSRNVMSFGWGFYSIFGFIGTPIHEFSHYIMCKLWGFKVTKVAWYRPIAGRKDGCLGYVQFSMNPDKLLHKVGSFFVGIAPMFGGCIAIILFMLWLLPNVFSGLLTLETYNFDTVCGVFESSEYSMLNLIVYLFLVCSISMHMDISSADLKHVLYGVIWLELIVLVLNFLPFADTILVGLNTISIVVIGCLVIGLIANIITLILTKVATG